MKEEFIEFLKTWGVYGKFMDNCAMPETITEDIAPHEYVSSEFVWGGSNEGFRFWDAIHDEWVNYIEYWKDDTGLFKAV